MIVGAVVGCFFLCLGGCEGGGEKKSRRLTPGQWEKVWSGTHPGTRVWEVVAVKGDFLAIAVETDDPLRVNDMVLIQSAAENEEYLGEARVIKRLPTEAHLRSLPGAKRPPAAGDLAVRRGQKADR